jgi:hypothetical protein
VPEWYLFALQLHICNDTTLCGQRLSYVWKLVPYSHNIPHPNKTTCRYFRQSVDDQSLAWWFVFKFRTVLTWLGLCTLQSLLVSCGSELHFFLYFCFWSFRNIAHVFCVVSAKSAVHSGAISANYLTSNEEISFLCLCYLQPKCEYCLLLFAIYCIIIYLIVIHSILVSIVRYFSEILPLPLPTSFPFSCWVSFALRIT